MKQLANAVFAALLTAPAAGFCQEKQPAEPQITIRDAKTEAETKARLRADQMLARCQYKPVMTDEEIAECVAAHRASVEAVRAAKPAAKK